LSLTPPLNGKEHPEFFCAKFGTNQNPAHLPPRLSHAFYGCKRKFSLSWGAVFPPLLFPPRRFTQGWTGWNPDRVSVSLYPLWVLAPPPPHGLTAFEIRQFFGFFGFPGFSLLSLLRTGSMTSRFLDPYSRVVPPLQRSPVSFFVSTCRQALTFCAFVRAAKL